MTRYGTGTQKPRVLCSRDTWTHSTPLRAAVRQETKRKKGAGTHLGCYASDRRVGTRYAAGCCRQQETKTKKRTGHVDTRNAAACCFYVETKQTKTGKKRATRTHRGCCAVSDGHAHVLHSKALVGQAAVHVGRRLHCIWVVDLLPPACSSISYTVYVHVYNVTKHCASKHIHRERRYLLQLECK